METIYIGICENDNYGKRSGVATQIQVDLADGEIGLIFEPKYWPDGVDCITDSLRVVEIHGNRFKFNHYVDWHGNMAWNGYYFPPDYGLGLINTLIRSKMWSIIQGWSDLIDKIDRGEMITGFDLELSEDYQPLCLNPNQYKLPFLQ